MCALHTTEVLKFPDKLSNFLCIYRPRRMWRLNEVCQKTASDWFCLCIYMPRRMWRLSEVCQKTASDWLCLCRPLRMWRLSEVCLVWRSSCLPARRQPKWLLEGRPTTRSPTPTTASWVFIYIFKKQQQNYQIYNLGEIDSLGVICLVDFCFIYSSGYQTNCMSDIYNLNISANS